MLVESCIPVIPSASPDKPDSYEGLNLYWAPSDIHALRGRLVRLGVSVSEIEDRGYGQTGFHATDDDGYALA